MKEIILNNMLELRTAKGLTQEDLAKILGVSRQTIIAMEKGNYVPSVLLAIKVADYFGKSVQDIFTIKKVA